MCQCLNSPPRSRLQSLQDRVRCPPAALSCRGIDGWLKHCYAQEGKPLRNESFIVLSERRACLPYPNIDFWSALLDGGRVPVDDGKDYTLSVVDCGFLVMPTGRLVACDPFAALEKTSNLFVQVPPGRFRVLVTLADVSDDNDGSHMREAYATLMLDEMAVEAKRRIITPVRDAACPPKMDDDGTYYGFPVDAGTACFVDQGAVEALMPDGD